MLRIHLRPIGGGDPREYYLCQRCGGAIAAEYLYIQETGKAEAGTRTIEVHADEIKELPNAEITSSVVLPKLEEETAAGAGGGETETVAMPADAHEGPRKGNKRAAKESL